MQCGYEPCTVARACSAGAPAGRHFILRHDIDRREHKAALIAALEHGEGVAGTYYFRHLGGFNADVIRRVAELGHEIGYHYENLSACLGDVSAAMEDFRGMLAAIRKIAAVRTIAMHGAPLSAYDNRDLWRDHDFRAFDVDAEAYLSIDFSRYRYLTDTGRRWDAAATNLRDRATSAAGGDPKPLPRGTHDLMREIASGAFDRYYVTCHPERWADGHLEWACILGKDAMINLAKRCIGIVRAAREGR